METILNENQIGILDAVGRDKTLSDFFYLTGGRRGRDRKTG